MLECWDSINMLSKPYSVCTTTGWSIYTMVIHGRKYGRHTYISWIQDNALDQRKTHSKKMKREASIHGTITLPIHEHYMNTIEREREKNTELYQYGLYQTNNINMVKFTLTWWWHVHHMKYSDYIHLWYIKFIL